MSHRSFLSMLSFFICAICVLSPACASLMGFDFEDGTLQGWTIVSGNAGKQPSANDDDRWGGNYGKQGKYFIGTYENLKDEAQVEMRSPEFTITSDYISLLVGGGSYPDGEYIALCRASDGSVLMRETGANSEHMTRRQWDVSKYKGEKVYLKLVDRETGGWGHINVDDIHEMTPAEMAAIEKAKREKEAAKRRWLADLMKPGERKVYRGKELDDIAINMGGIGAGNIGVCGDGALRQWQIFNKVNTGCVVPGQFFGIWAKPANGTAVTRVLQQSAVGGIPGAQATEFIGEFPIAEIRYKDPALPVQVSMEAFSPFIPMNSKDSGIPGIYFVFKVRNPGKQPVSVSLLGSLQNAVGYDGGSKIEGVANQSYGGNMNKLLKDPNAVIIDMDNPSLPADAHQNGTMALGTLSKGAQVVEQYDDIAAMWSDFTKDGVLGIASKTGPSEKGITWNSALSTGIDLKPGEEKSVVFFITWHFPNFYADYDRSLAQYRLGHMYSNWFECACKAASYMAENYPRLSKQTHLFRDALYDSNLPYWFTTRISAPISTLTSQTCLWIEDGTFAAFEGCGCCPMNCTHVWNYEQTLACLFPDLERNMRHTDLTVQEEASGEVRHRTVLPLSAPRGTGVFVDGHLGTILKCYREYRRCPDRKWLDAMWPNIKLAMDFVLKSWDKNQDGVLVNEQWNTYDAAMYGPNTFIGTLYLGALRAAEEMAKVEDDARSAKQYRTVFTSGSRRLDSTLWNGEYYIQIDEKKEADLIQDAAWMTVDWPNETLGGANRPYGTGCHADQLLGQWWATMLDLGYLLPKDRVGMALDSIMKYNWRWDFGEVTQQRPFAGNGDMGMLICTWPKGGRPANSILYADEVWTGIDYEVAGLLIQEGKIREAYQMIKAVGDRYSGVRRPPITRSPWNEIECGDHYARAMSSWSMLLAAQGFTYSGPDGAVGFNPVIQTNDHRSFFSTAEGWGTFAQTRTAKAQTDTLQMKYGWLTLKMLTLGTAQTARPKSVKVILNGKPVKSNIKRNGKLMIQLSSPAVLCAGDKLTVTAAW